MSLATLQAYLPWLTADEFERLKASGNPYAHPTTTLPRILVETRLYHRLAVDWIRRKRPALSIVYLEGTDTIGHVFAAFAPPRQEGIDPADFERCKSVPRTYFREIDGLLGEYRTLAEETGAALLVVSDHGFLWARGTPAHQRPGGRDGRPLASRRRDLRAVGQGHRTLGGPGRGTSRAGGGHDPGAPRPAARGRHRGARLAGVAEVLPARNYGTRSPRRSPPAERPPTRPSTA